MILFVLYLWGKFYEWARGVEIERFSFVRSIRTSSAE